MSMFVIILVGFVVVVSEAVLSLSSSPLAPPTSGDYSNFRDLSPLITESCNKDGLWGRSDSREQKMFVAIITCRAISDVYVSA